MTISLQQFASGDTNYVAKLDSNMSIIESAINALQLAQSSGGSGGLSSPSLGAFLDVLFDSETTLIGVGSYVPNGVGASLTVAAGGAYRIGNKMAVESAVPVVLDFTGQSAGTYYVALDPIGNPVRSSIFVTDSIYSVVWSGSAFGTITKLVPVLFDSIEEANARISTILSTTYATLKDRLEAAEEATQDAQADATTALIDLAGRNRKVGLTVDGGGAVPSTGVKGAIQIDFDGTIIGWSIIADVPGDVAVEVSVARTSPPSVPPTDPPIPDPVADKISASAPIALTNPSGQQSAASAAAGVSTWTKTLQKWDVVQFKVASVSTLTRFSLYILIQPA